MDSNIINLFNFAVYTMSKLSTMTLLFWTYCLSFIFFFLKRRKINRTYTQLTVLLLQNQSFMELIFPMSLLIKFMRVFECFSYVCHYRHVVHDEKIYVVFFACLLMLFWYLFIIIWTFPCRVIFVYHKKLSLVHIKNFPVVLFINFCRLFWYI